MFEAFKGSPIATKQMTLKLNSKKMGISVTASNVSLSHMSGIQLQTSDENNKHMASANTLAPESLSMSETFQYKHMQMMLCTQQ